MSSKGSGVKELLEQDASATKTPAAEQRCHHTRLRLAIMEPSVNAGMCVSPPWGQSTCSPFGSGLLFVVSIAQKPTSVSALGANSKQRRQRDCDCLRRAESHGFSREREVCGSLVAHLGRHRSRRRVLIARFR